MKPIPALQANIICIQESFLAASEFLVIEAVQRTWLPSLPHTRQTYRQSNGWHHHSHWPTHSAQVARPTTKQVSSAHNFWSWALDAHQLLHSTTTAHSRRSATRLPDFYAGSSAYGWSTTLDRCGRLQHDPSHGSWYDGATSRHLCLFRFPLEGKPTSWPHLEQQSDTTPLRSQSQSKAERPQTTTGFNSIPLRRKQPSHRCIPKQARKWTTPPGYTTRQWQAHIGDAWAASNTPPERIIGQCVEKAWRNFNQMIHNIAEAQSFQSWKQKAATASPKPTEPHLAVGKQPQPQTFRANWLARATRYLELQDLLKQPDISHACQRAQQCEASNLLCKLQLTGVQQRNPHTFSHWFQSRIENKEQQQAMLRCLIFTCISTWAWCSAAWSSLAILHELGAPLLDLHFQFYMNLMLRCLIFVCSWTWCSAAWSSSNSSLVQTTFLRTLEPAHASN